jgi:hypothetical protein
MTDFAPVNYGAMQPQHDFGQTLANGLATGDLIHQRQLETQKLAAQQARMQKMQDDVTKTFNNPLSTPEDIVNLAGQYPEFAEPYMKIAKSMDDKTRDAKVNLYGNAYAAVLNGNIDLAKSLIKEQAEAYHNSGDEKNAKAYDSAVNMIEQNPAHARNHVAMLLSQAMGADKFVSTFSGLNKEQRDQEQAPLDLEGKKLANEKAGYDVTKSAVEAAYAQPKTQAEVDKAQADAIAAGVTADNAPQKQSLDMQNTQANIDESVAKTNASNVKTDALTQQDSDNGLVNLGLPKPKRLPWADVKDAKQKAMLQSRVYSASEAALAKEREEVVSKNSLAQDAQRFLELNTKIPTGGFADKYSAGQWAKSFGDDYSEMQAITAKLVPLMRAPGSGSTSDFDAKMFKQGTVGVDKPGKTNESIANALIARAKQADDYLTFKQDYLQQNGTLQGADQYWKEYANKNPIFDPKKPNSFELNKNRKDYQEYFGGDASTGGNAAPSNAPLTPSPAIAAKAKQLGWSNEQLQQFLRDHSK